jgi:hypothetical protein
MEAASMVIAQVNPLMPRTWGDSFVHVDDIVGLHFLRGYFILLTSAAI